MNASTAEPAKPITPKDVFQRSNMPSRWERLTGVSPKTPTDRKFLAFMAARYRGDERLPRPDELETPAAVAVLRSAQVAGCTAFAIGAIAFATGASTETAELVALGVILVGASLAGMLMFSITLSPTIAAFRTLQRRCEAAEARVRGDVLHAHDATTLDEMILCDEGTLSYCAAKIAAEIERDPAWEKHAVDYVAIDLWDELADIAASARQIAQDRKATRDLERGRLRDDPEVRAVISEDKQHRREALKLLASRVHAFADYRDRIHRHGMAAQREHDALNRMIRLTADEQAAQRLGH